MAELEEGWYLNLEVGVFRFKKSENVIDHWEERNDVEVGRLAYVASPHDVDFYISLFNNLLRAVHRSRLRRVSKSLEFYQSLKFLSWLKMDAVGTDEASTLVADTDLSPSLPSVVLGLLVDHGNFLLALEN